MAAREKAGGRSGRQGYPFCRWWVPPTPVPNAPIQPRSCSLSFWSQVLKVSRQRSLGLFPSLQSPYHGLWERAVGDKKGFSSFPTLPCLL